MNRCQERITIWSFEYRCALSIGHREGHEGEPTPTPKLELPQEVREALENLCSDLEECARLAFIEKAEARTYKSFAATARKIQAAFIRRIAGEERA